MEKLSSPSSSSSSWDEWVEAALSRLESLKLIRSLRPIDLSTDPLPPSNRGDDYEVFEDIQPWDRRAVEVSISMPTFQKWLLDIPSAGDEGVGGDGVAGYEVGKYKKLLLFSGNDYLGLSSHPSIAKAAIKAAQDHGMGPRGSALICGYTNHHRFLESSLADLKKKEDCLLCPTGFAANMAFMVALGNIPSLLASSRKPVMKEKIAVFSDALNHASIIDGIHLAERQKAIEVHIYKHCDMSHLSSLLSNSKLKKKVVITDGSAHGTFVCGKDGGVAEQFNCEKYVDICVGTLSKAAGCHENGSYSYSEEVGLSYFQPLQQFRLWLPPMRLLQSQKKKFGDEGLSGVPITSHVISLIVGNEEKALQASRHLLKSGFHVTAIRPPTVPPNSCRLRVALSAAHTKDDLKKLAAALSHCVDLQDAGSQTLTGHARL